MKREHSGHIESPDAFQNNRSVLEILSQAIYNEQSAHEFYAGLVGQIVNTQAQAMFTGLADDEQRHRRLLEARYREMSQGQFFPFDAGKVKKISLSVDSQTKAVDAVELAMAAEHDASESYRAAAARAQDAEGKRMFESLAEEEDRHHEILLAERESLLGRPYWFSADEQRTME